MTLATTIPLSLQLLHQKENPAVCISDFKVGNLLIKSPFLVILAKTLKFVFLAYKQSL